MSAPRAAAAIAARAAPAHRPRALPRSLPSCCLITPPPYPNFVADFAAACARGPRLAIFRAPALDAPAYLRLAARLCDIARDAHVALLLHDHPDAVARLGAAGAQLSQRAARGLRARPVSAARWLGVSCHDAAELRRAAALGADFCLLGAVRRTPTHPGRAPLGWRAFAQLARRAPLPVFALGGAGPNDLAWCRALGAHGVAGVRGFWPQAERRA